jgi:CRISPR type III-A-associated protein Csm2
MDEQKMKNLYPEYSKFRFFDESHKLKWVSEYAEAFSLQIAYERENYPSLIQRKYNYKNPIKALTTTALRNFYNEFLHIKEIKDPEQKMIMIKLLKAKVNYKKHQKSGPNIPDDFVKFIEALVDQINEDIEKNFEFASHIMEAIVAYNPLM